MHATLILLDRSFAFWTWLCINLHPKLRVILTLVQTVLPLDESVAVDRQMSILCAREAERLMADIALNVYLLVRLVFNCRVAVSPWTPLRLLRQINKRLYQEVFVTIIEVHVYKFPE